MKRKKMPLGSKFTHNSALYTEGYSIVEAPTSLQGRIPPDENAKINGVRLQRDRKISIHACLLNGLKESDSFH